MERLSYIELAGRQCPLNFSLGAVEEIGRRYGSLEGMQEAFSAFDEKPIHEALGDILWILAVLLRQGAEYCRVMEGREEEPFTEEQLKCLLGAQDAGRTQKTGRPRRAGKHCVVLVLREDAGDPPPRAVRDADGGAVRLDRLLADRPGGKGAAGAAAG